MSHRWLRRLGASHKSGLMAVAHLPVVTDIPKGGMQYRQYQRTICGNSIATNLRQNLVNRLLLSGYAIDFYRDFGHQATWYFL
jgi:hypothetical protein